MKSLTLWPWILALVVAVGSASAGLTLRSARQQGREAAALTALRAIAAAQDAFREQDVDGNGVADYAGDLQSLVSAGLLPPQLSLPGPYRYRVATGRSPEFLWMAVAVPEHPADRCFAINHYGVVRAGVVPAPFNAGCELPEPPCEDCGSQAQCEHRGIGQ